MRVRVHCTHVTPIHKHSIHFYSTKSRFQNLYFQAYSYPVLTIRISCVRQIVSRGGGDTNYTDDKVTQIFCRNFITIYYKQNHFSVTAKPLSPMCYFSEGIDFFFSICSLVAFTVYNDINEKAPKPQPCD